MAANETPKRTVRAAKPALPARGMSLLVIGEGLCTSHPIPDEGEVIIGRDPGCDVVIDDESVSRRHARLRLGPPPTIEDLESANGTRVRDSWLPPERPTPLVCGEVVDVGSAMVILQDRALSTHQRRIWSHLDFEARLDEECARATRSGAFFVVARLQFRGEAPDQTVTAALDQAIRSSDVLGRTPRGEFEVLLPDVDATEADDARSRILGRLRDQGVEATLGLARFPNDGREPARLLALAGAAARGEPPPAPSPSIVVTATAMEALERLVRRVAAGNISVLILGETGVGKEVLAERVHELSPRTANPFLRLNCAALSESLLESELFGHEKGAFTGAIQAKPGLLESAEGGTVFLDEVGELPVATQVKLLRVLEARQVLRVGALKPRPIDVRFVAATNRELEREVEAGRFRQDLYFRLNGISLVIPPLRERVGEIAGLTQTFLARFCREAVMKVPAVDPGALALLETHAWPGNIRELRNVVERAVLLCGEGPIRPEHLPMTAERRAPARTAAPPPPAESTRLRSQLGDLERQRILDALEQCAGNQTRAAALLGMPRRTLVTRLAAYDIPRPRKRP